MQNVSFPKSCMRTNCVNASGSTLREIVCAVECVFATPIRMESEGISRLEENADRAIMTHKRRKFPYPSYVTACLSFPPFRSCSPGSVCTFGFASGVAPQTVEIPCRIYTLMRVMHPIFYIANQASLRSFVYALGM